MYTAHARHRLRGPICLSLAFLLSGCAAMGSLMSPYSEKFSCKNDDHGQCIHPAQAYEDAVVGTRSGSDPAVTNDRSMLHGGAANATGRGSAPGSKSVYGAYRDSVYEELKGLIDAPVTPMLRPARTVRTLILPYADRARPDRLYMPRYIYSVLDRPEWVIGGTLVSPPDRVMPMPILGQVRTLPAISDKSPEPLPAPAPVPGEARP